MRMLGPDRLIFVKTEDFDRRPAEVMAEVYRWAGLRPTADKVLHSNFAACRGSIARGAWTERTHQVRLLCGPRPLRGRVTQGSAGVWGAAPRAGADGRAARRRPAQAAESGECAKMGAGKFSMQKHFSKDIEQRLSAHFKPHNRRFSEITGIPTEDWDRGSKYTQENAQAGEAALASQQGGGWGGRRHLAAHASS